MSPLRGYRILPRPRVLEAREADKVQEEVPLTAPAAAAAMAAEAGDFKGND